MEFRHELSYDAAPAQVYAMLADPAFREAVMSAMRVISSDVQLDRGADGEGFTLVIEQQQSNAGLPSFARTFAGESTHAIQREVWLAQDTGSLDIESPGKPATVAGTIRLEPDGTGTTEVVELDLKVRVPLIGGKLERLLSDTIRAGMDVEHTVGVTWLKEH